MNALLDFMLFFFVNDAYRFIESLLIEPNIMRQARRMVLKNMPCFKKAKIKAKACHCFVVEHMKVVRTISHLV